MLNKKIIITLVLLAFVFGSFAIAFSEPLVPSLNEYQKELNPSHYSILGFTLGKNTLYDVKKKLGYTEVVRGNGVSDPNQLFYVSSLEDDNTVIIFEAGPLGQWKNLDCFTITSRDLLDKNIKCTPTSYLNKNTSTDSGLKLGLNQEQVEKIIGDEPISKTDSTYTYYYGVHRKMSEEELLNGKKGIPDIDKEYFIDISSYIEVKFKSDKLTSFKIEKTVSY